MDTLTLEDMARWHGMTVRRSRQRDRCWLIRDGALFSPRRGHTEREARALLAVRTS